MDSLCNKVPPPIQYNVIRYNSDNKPSHYYYFGDKIGTKYAPRANVKMIQINESIYPHDTLKQVLHKIAIHCYKHINGDGLFAWYKNNKREIHPFHLDPVLPIKNPFIETNYEKYSFVCRQYWVAR